MGAVYEVSDSAGWINTGHLDYKSWSSTKTFHVGDTIMFEYNKQFQNVIRVTHKNFNTCNATYNTCNATYNTIILGCRSQHQLLQSHIESLGLVQRRHLPQVPKVGATKTGSSFVVFPADPPSSSSIVGRTNRTRHYGAPHDLVVARA
ncbi:hypothetical protein U1Q18_023174 [Sarracenia purpurea var. burkii]